MLILNRRTNESIVIDNNIEITVLSISTNQIKIGVNAPKNIEIFRKEIWLRARDEQNTDVLNDNKEVQQ
ncbi:MAG: carbon storage regulator CsrA [Gammaproteobacteria bacterium]|jgi:carbon storage regulator